MLRQDAVGRLRYAKIRWYSYVKLENEDALPALKTLCLRKCETAISETFEKYINDLDARKSPEKFYINKTKVRIYSYYSTTIIFFPQDLKILKNYNRI